MDPVFSVLVTTAAGALVGTSVGVLLMRRHLRPLITEADLTALKNNLQSSQAAAAAAAASAEALQKQVHERYKTIQEAHEDLKQKQQQLDLTLAQAEELRVKHSMAEQTVQGLGTQIDLLTEECAKLDVRARELANQLAQKTTELVCVQGELDAAVRKNEELTKQIARVTAESAELQSSREQESRHRASLESRLELEQGQIRQLAAQVAQLRDDRAQSEIRLQQERQSAAKGMELLLLAQEKLSAVFKPGGVESRSGSSGNGFDRRIDGSREQSTTPGETLCE
jgi:chromosome segregation ATPase